MKRRRSRRSGGGRATLLLLLTTPIGKLDGADEHDEFAPKYCHDKDLQNDLVWLALSV